MMIRLLRLLANLSGPVLFGLLVAAIVILLFPERYPLPLRAWLALDSDSIKSPEPVSYAKAVQKAAPSVVNIYTKTRVSGNSPLQRYRNSTRPRTVPNTGSGVIVSADGYIITNRHVIYSPEEIRVALQDGREVEPELIGTSIRDDIALLKINAEKLVPIDLGDSESAQIGDVVLAIGNPFGWGQTVTQGIISTHRNSVSGSELDFIQTDAAINPGNSGGALVDAYGNLLGITTLTLTSTIYGEASGISLAIPTTRALQAMETIIAEAQEVRGYMGMTAENVDQLALQIFPLGSEAGIWIAAVAPGGPSQIAGLRRYDVITEINGISIKNLDDAITLLVDAKPGDVIAATINRQGQVFELDIILSQPPDRRY